MTDNRTPPPVTVTLDSGPTGSGNIDDFELFYARRALDRFRARLGRQGLLDLLAADIEQGNAFLRESALASDGSFKAGTTVLTTRGLASGTFLAWMDKAFAGDEKALLAAHPEHYVMAPGADGSFNVVENIGPHVCSFFMGGWGTDAMAWAADADELLPESEFPHKMSSNLFLPDGTVVGRALTQFGDTADGFTASLTVYVPTTCPPDVLEHHLRHYAVEFRTWIIAAATAHA
ncbi:hypothetical protein [Streptomyces laculatispora]|uniref:hypothetical protein n=1 Tax=Streptomyces laculatispora TaxID=887464 RepID=UPI001A9502B2|nr:hypothetical protein [Streptomyces laculatispora]MBO0918826.1 hypothetical protein [Streptomyces laculatispora]